MAAEFGHSAVCNILLAAGANLNATRSSGFTSLHIAASKGHSRVCTALLAAGAKVHAVTPEGVAPLFLVAQMAALRCAPLCWPR